MFRQIQQQAVVTETLSGLRIDQAAARLFPEFSRARLQGWLRDGQLRVDGQRRRPAERLVGGETLSLDAVLEAEQSWQAQPLALSMVYEDKHLIVLDKAAGMVVHPAAGHRDGTLVNALLNHCPDLAQLPRAGIVHRLDRDTSGLMVVARTLEAHHGLVKQLQARRVHREYQALLQGALLAGGTVSAPIGRHPRQRKKMAVLEHGGKEAVTHYRPLRRYRDFTSVRCLLETGRTHQIRVHMAHIGHPLVGDPVYGGRRRYPRDIQGALLAELREFKRQALHARALELDHPCSGEPMRWESKLPEDFRRLLAALEEDREQCA